MGGGGFLGLGPAPSAPAAPDYRGAAQDTAAGNLEAARVATAANRVNQVTPYGNLNYAETGTDTYGNPTWTATTSLSDVGQQLLNNQNATSLGLGSAINAQLGQVQNTMGQPFNPQTGPITTNVGNANLQQLTGNANLQNLTGNANLQNQTDYAGGMQGWDRANQLLMQRLQPQMDIQQKTLDAKLANQGLAPGTEAYNRAKMGLGMQQNDLLNQAQLSGLSAGNTLFNQGLQGAQFGNAAQQQGYANQQAQQAANNALAQQQFGNSQQQQAANNALAQQQFGNQLANANLGNTAQQQQYNQAMTQYNMPLNTLSALRSGSQVQNPSFVNSAQQATTQGADILGATQMGYNAQMGNFNAQQAAQQGMNSGLMSLGGTLGAAAIMSDIRTKEKITQVYWLPNGLPVYTYEYKPEFKDEAGHGVHIGVMAQEVEQIMPEAVITRADGIKMVDYGVLNA